MEVSEATAWSGQGRIQEGRHKNTKLIFGVLGVFGIVIVVLALNMTKKAPAVVKAASVKAGPTSDTLPSFEDIKDPTTPPSPPNAGSGPDSQLDPRNPGKGGGKGHGPQRGRAPAPHGPLAPGAFAPSGGVTPPPPDQPSGGGTFAEPERKAPVAPATVRPPPSQGEITRVIGNNKIGIKTCYQRALLRDSSLTHGKIVVGVTIGLSGRVKQVRVDGPSSFRSLEPCIKEMVGHWAFPPASEEYGTEFSYLFQGNE
jgi:hypothetical protein